MIFIVGVIGVWLAGAVLVYVLFVHRRFRIDESLRNFPAPGLIAAGLLGPGAALGAHFVLPMPPAVAVAFSAFTGNLPSAGFNAVIIVLMSLIFLVTSRLLNRRAAHS